MFWLLTPHRSRARGSLATSSEVPPPTRILLLYTQQIITLLLIPPTTKSFHRYVFIKPIDITLMAPLSPTLSLLSVVYKVGRMAARRGGDVGFVSSVTPAQQIALDRPRCAAVCALLPLLPIYVHGQRILREVQLCRLCGSCGFLRRFCHVSQQVYYTRTLHVISVVCGGVCAAVRVSPVF